MFTLNQITMIFRTFCKKDEKNGDDDGTDSSAAPVTSDIPREIEGLLLKIKFYLIKCIWDHSTIVN